MLCGLPPWYDPLQGQNRRIHRLVPFSTAALSGGPRVHAVLLMPESDDVEVARVESGQHHGQVVGLGATVGQIHHL